MIDDPIETEQWLALNAYLCACSAFGCFSSADYTVPWFGVYPDEAFYMGLIFSVATAVLLALADFRVPTKIWSHVVLRGRAR